MFMPRAVHVPVGQFLFGRRPERGDFYIEIELFTSQGMIEIQLDGLIADLFDDGILDLVILVPYLELRTEFHWNCVWEVPSRDIHNACGIEFAVAISRCDSYFFAHRSSSRRVLFPGRG